jgi:hypothetical protein
MSIMGAVCSFVVIVQRQAGGGKPSVYKKGAEVMLTAAPFVSFASPCEGGDLRR